ncbi:hypothetical protein LLF88_05705 [bacterium]|nr:hypothetical protein [bacterium]
MEEAEQVRGEEMGLTVKQRQAVMEELRKQYHHASKKEKSRILDEFVDLTHLNRSYARCVLRAKETGRTGPVHHSRASVYTAVVLPALTEFWHVSDRLCGKRLVLCLQRIIPFLETRGQLDLAPAVRDLLLRMSPATCDRLLQGVRTKEEPWEHPHPRPGMLLLKQVPVQTAAEWWPGVSPGSAGNSSPKWYIEHLTRRWGFPPPPKVPLVLRKHTRGESRG